MKENDLYKADGALKGALNLDEIKVQDAYQQMVEEHSPEAQTFLRSERCCQGLSMRYSPTPTDVCLSAAKKQRANGSQAETVAEVVSQSRPPETSTTSTSTTSTSTTSTTLPRQRLALAPAPAPDVPIFAAPAEARLLGEV